jgi:hypothetical protein
MNGKTLRRREIKLAALSKEVSGAPSTIKECNFLESPLLFFENLLLPFQRDCVPPGPHCGIVP